MSTVPSFLTPDTFCPVFEQIRITLPGGSSYITIYTKSFLPSIKISIKPRQSKARIQLEARNFDYGSYQVDPPLFQVSCFGMSLVKLDIRQESERHMDAVDAITVYLGIGSYKSWSEEEKQAWLLKELQGKRPLFGADLETSDEVKEVLDTFRVIAEFPTESFGAYVISMVSL
jgi:hypothetical protein